MRIARIALLSLAILSAPVLAQPADLPVPAAKPGPLPAGIRIGKIGGRAYYTDQAGHVLYGMDMRVLLRDGPDPAQHCTGDCSATWLPLLAPAGAKPNIGFPQGFGQAPVRPGYYSQMQDPPDWTVIAGAQGPQWVYKGWHMVFTRRTDGKTDRHDGAENRAFNTLKYIAPPPNLQAPPDVHAVVKDGGYILTDGRGRHLFTGSCTRGCPDWQPYRAGMAARAVGQWQPVDGGEGARWVLAGQPVFITAADAPSEVPAGAKVLRP